MNILKPKTIKKAEAQKVVVPKTNSYGGVSVLKELRRSEKAGDLSKYSQYVFLVMLSATKPGIRKEVEKRYGVKVLGVNVIRQKGKIKRLGATVGRRSDFKKAVVTLKEGNKIDIS